MAFPRKRVLLFTNSELGQANVVLATSHALLELGAEVHFASFSAIEDLVTAVSKEIRFHPIDGVDMKTAYPRDEVARSGLEGKTPRFWNMPRVLRICLHTTMPWSGPEYVDIYRSVIAILQEVSPSIIAVDPAFSPAITACKHMGERFLILAPNTIKDFAISYQPARDVFFTYPCIASGLPFPLPWYYVLLNIYYVLLAIAICRWDRKSREVKRYIKDYTAGEMVSLEDLNRRPPPGVKYLVANLPEIEFALKTIPPHIIPCGPITRPVTRPVTESDPHLARWLDRGPTVYINLGTHAKTTEATAIEMAKSLAFLLRLARQRGGEKKEVDGSLQVLWKLTRKGDYGNDSIGMVLRDVQDAVRIVEWVAPEPSAVLAHRNVICAVHHGGANSFLEAVTAGLPQIVLPVWIDCFDYANRAEVLEIGRWGNRTARPRCVATELGPVLVGVIFGPGAAKYKENAEALARLCGRDLEPGRIKAARTILAEI
ncbi:glycosyltransferase family 1 protein [Apodospora peruviana]|uniref:Glycosyltransferase family 1 protein n=1 Tax=Apodospora peruviana TaxID=516989 RepID=A0AAE0IRG8_9PEZI|nr:glycosyltransferase family 1 protein [Apodospora peruviana]